MSINASAGASTLAPSLHSFANGSADAGLPESYDPNCLSDLPAAIDLNPILNSSLSMENAIGPSDSIGSLTHDLILPVPKITL